MSSDDTAYVPTLIVMSVVDEEGAVVLRQQWSHCVELQAVMPVLSHNLLVVEEVEDYSLFSMDDGTQLHNIQLAPLGCWIYSGLYPQKSCWKALAKNTVWNSPFSNPALKRTVQSLFEITPNAMVFETLDAHVIEDYSI
ncbi:hypothetical protein THASP1DRAFT_31589 [Thamnocephalis sphaerospora]|uniref:Uncharacterized protein n=1 Tax=Thamnocephalis sphaerospora TaxID=78915 RepID=A0A4P9XL74_9FUNG|nr:hypothetical protein THASP1DRAFT_31589 [Thamnocephalis sphaerospora]|eukprot:RKP06603.1 hypothetical protein THASP1DRAFT_31589 [Thamnocephalis sphaerospora]